MPSLLRRSIAETLGTFALVFIGTAVIASKFYPDANFADPRRSRGPRDRPLGDGHGNDEHLGRAT